MAERNPRLLFWKRLFATWICDPMVEKDALAMELLITLTWFVHPALKACTDHWWTHSYLEIRQVCYSQITPPLWTKWSMAHCWSVISCFQSSSPSGCVDHSPSVSSAGQIFGILKALLSFLPSLLSCSQKPGSWIPSMSQRMPTWFKAYRQVVTFPSQENLCVYSSEMC